MLTRVVDIYKNGYKKVQQEVPLADRVRYLDQTEKDSILNDNILIKHDKSHATYHYSHLIDDLKTFDPDEFGKLMNASVANYGCQNAYEILFEKSVKFKSI